MTLYSTLMMVLTLIFVLGLMALLALVLKRMGFAGAQVSTIGQKRRLNVVESLPLTPQTRLVLIKRDDTEHLVIVGPNGQTVIETGITAHDHQK